MPMAHCAKYWWDAPNDRESDTRPAAASEIQFVGGDVLDGPAHFNDTPLLTDSGGVQPNFKQGLRDVRPGVQAAAVTGDDQLLQVLRPHARPVPTTAAAGAVLGGAKLDLPDNSDQFQNFPGCQYTGATRIRFNATAR